MSADLNEHLRTFVVQYVKDNDASYTEAIEAYKQTYDNRDAGILELAMSYIDGAVDNSQDMNASQALLALEAHLSLRCEKQKVRYDTARQNLVEAAAAKNKLEKAKIALAGYEDDFVKRSLNVADEDINMAIKYAMERFNEAEQNNKNTDLIRKDIKSLANLRKSLDYKK